MLPYSTQAEYEALLKEQVRIEEQASHDALLKGLQQVREAVDQGRVSDIPIGRRLIASAFEVLLPIMKEFYDSRARGTAGKYQALVRRVDVEIVTAIVLRQMLNAAIAGYHDPVKARISDVLRGIGWAVEMEALVADLKDFAPAYTEKTLKYLDDGFTSAPQHRRRTLMSASKNTGVDFEPWTSDEKIAVGRSLCSTAFETGLFRWVEVQVGKGTPTYYLSVSEAVQEHLEALASDPQMHNAWVYPPCVIPPQPWTSFWEGGYHTLGLTKRCTLMHIRGRTRQQRQWILEHLKADTAAPARAAANAAQSVPYRVNTRVLEVLGDALAAGTGLLGLPRTLSMPKPQFPHMEDWIKDNASTEELEAFQAWKDKMCTWYEFEKKRKGMHSGITGKLRELRKYSEYKCLYFPTFFDWRGRLYFRSTLNPQSADAIKGCLDLAEGRPLGERGLYWLRVHVANCCGFDKHDNDIREQWTKDNWRSIEEFLDDPINIQAPEPDTAFSLLQAGWALQEALDLPNPAEYICHVPVAQDATCSGLQHFSAMLKDPIGALYTNLVDNGTDKKSDIYMKVAEGAQRTFCELETDEVILDYWKDKPISRSMAKRPVMVYVYGGTLKSTMDYVVVDMLSSGYAPVLDSDGTVLYSAHKLSVGIGKALRLGVEETVPSAAAGMRYLQRLCRWAVDAEGKGKELSWISPVGIPVVNWAEGYIEKRVNIRSMGIYHVTVSMRSGEYDCRKATSAVAPNFIHSLDGAHLCKVINAADCSIVPIHDSFATHPDKVDELRDVLVQQFYSMYKDDVLALIDTGVQIREDRELERPVFGNLDISAVLTARFPFC